MSNLEPSGPSQPPVDAAYKTQGNPVTSAPSEQSTASQEAKNDIKVEERNPHSVALSHQDATASSLGRGVHGAPLGEELKGQTQGRLDRSHLDGEQLGPSGEGEVADAVERKSGATGEQPDLVGNLEGKKKEQSR